MIKNQYGTNIKKFRTNNPKEYFSYNMNPYLPSYGIIHESSCVYTLQQNGLAEIKKPTFIRSISINSISN